MRGKFSAAQREAIFARAGGCCEVCGDKLPERGWNAHHRKALGMGGTRREVTCADGLAVCGSGNTSGCHRLMDQERAWAVIHGYVIPRNSAIDPLRQPVLTARFRWVLFEADGSVQLAAAVL